MHQQHRSPRLSTARAARLAPLAAALALQGWRRPSSRRRTCRSSKAAMPRRAARSTSARPRPSPATRTSSGRRRARPRPATRCRPRRCWPASTSRSAASASRLTRRSATTSTRTRTSSTTPPTGSVPASTGRPSGGFRAPCRSVAQQNLARYGTESTTQTTERNIERARQFNATVQYGGPSVLAIYGLFDHRSIDYSLATFDPLDYKRSLVGAGVALSRQRRADARRRGAHRPGRVRRRRVVGQGDEFDRHELAVDRPMGAHRCEPHSRPPGSHRAEARRRRRAISPARPARWPGTGDPPASCGSRPSCAATPGRKPIRCCWPAWSMQSATTATSRTGCRCARSTKRRRRSSSTRCCATPARSLVDTLTIPGFTISNAGDDNTTVLTLGARYNPTRTIALGCGVGREDRSADSSVSYSYRVNSANCYAQILLNP